MELGEEQRRREADAQEFLLFRLNSPTKHALPLNFVHRLEEFKRSQVELSLNHRVVRYRNSILPIIPLNRLLGLPAEEATKGEVISVLVVLKDEHFYGIEVNEILDVLSSRAVLDTSLTQTSSILGNLVTDTEVVVVLDPFKIIRQAFPVAARNFEESAEGMRRLRILLAEDTSFFRKHVSALLEKEGYQVLQAKDGEEAITMLRKGECVPIDLIVSDIEMPKMNGLQLAEAVRKESAWKSTPLVALTTKFDDRSVREGLDAGFNTYLEKLDPAQLLATISSLMKRNN